MIYLNIIDDALQDIFKGMMYILNKIDSKNMLIKNVSKITHRNVKQ